MKANLIVYLSIMLLWTAGVGLHAQTWQSVASPAFFPLLSVAFCDHDNGCAVGAGGTILMTSDGGATWQTAPCPVNDDLTGVCYVDASHICISDVAGSFVYSIDGGTTWDTYDTGLEYALRCVAIDAGGSGVAGGDSQTILRTDDFGQNWNVVQTDMYAGGFYAAEALGDGQFFLIGQNSIIAPLSAFSVDNGSNWIFRDFYWVENAGTMVEGIALGADCFDNQSAVCVGNTWDFRGTVAWSDDFFESWHSTFFEITQRIDDVDIPSDTLGFLVGSEGTIARTYDAGQTWTEVESPTQSNLHACKIFDNGDGIIVGDNGTILRRTAVEQILAPQDFAVTALGFNRLHFTWTIPNGSFPVHYNLYQVDNDPPAVVATTSGLSIDLNDLPPCERHYRLRAVYDTGWAETNVIEGVVTLPAPENLTASVTSPGSVRLSWQIPTRDLQYCSLYRDGARIYWGAASEYNDAGLDPATQYAYWMTAHYSGEWDSEPGDTIYVTPASAEDNTNEPMLRLTASPNPFGKSVRLSFDAPGARPVRVEIYDLRGRRVYSETTRSRTNGHCEVLWNGKDANGSVTAPGVYLARIGTRGPVVKLLRLPR
jgi:photosystem II stability/assembly factor-like uncharacterized protein